MNPIEIIITGVVVLMFSVIVHSQQEILENMGDISISAKAEE